MIQQRGTLFAIRGQAEVIPGGLIAYYQAPSIDFQQLPRFGLCIYARFTFTALGLSLTASETHRDLPCSGRSDTRVLEQQGITPRIK